MQFIEILSIGYHHYYHHHPQPFGEKELLKHF